MKIFLRIYSKMILMAGSLLGLAAGCQPAEYGPGTGSYRDDDLQPEYGVPMATYEVTGHVYDNQDSTPLPNIQLTGNTYSGEPSTITSSAKGAYTLQGYSMGETEFTIILSDADSADGVHQSDTVQISLQYTNSDDNQDEGHAKAQKDVYLKRIDK